MCTTIRTDFFGLTFFVVTAGAIVRSTLSARPAGDTRKPWKWRFVTCGSRLTNFMSMVSPGFTFSVGPGNVPVKVRAPPQRCPLMMAEPSCGRNVTCRTPFRLRTTFGSL